MAKPAILAQAFGNYNSNSTTRYSALCTGTIFVNATESLYQVLFRTAGTLSELRIYVSSNATSGSTTLKVRKNTADGNIAISVGAGATGDFSDITDSDSVSVTDLICYQIIGGTGGQIFVPTFCIQFDSGSNYIARYGGGSGFSVNQNSSNRYIGIISEGTNVNESDVRFKCKSSFTCQNLQLYLSTNSRAVVDTYGVKKSGSSGNMVISTTASTTGRYEDTTNSDSFASDDYISYYVTTGASSSSSVVTHVSVESSASNNQILIIATVAPINSAVPANATRYSPIAGNNTSNTIVSTELNTGIIVPTGFTWSNLETLVFSNTVTAATTLISRINTANGTQSVSITASATGYFEDASNSDTVSDGDRLDVKIVAGATGTNIQFTNIGSLATFPASPVITNLPTRNIFHR